MMGARMQRLTTWIITAAAVVVVGCASSSPAPSTPQPATAIDPATTQPSYWMDQQPTAQVVSNDFYRMWTVALNVTRDFAFRIDRTDYREGLITTQPMVSKQLFEVWRRDAGTLGDEAESSLATIRRTLVIEFVRQEDNSYTATPKVLVERLAVLERRVTSVSQARSGLAGLRDRSQYAVRSDARDLPPRYWYPIDRDRALEREIATLIQREMR